MKPKKLFFPILLFVCATLPFSACAVDPYKDYEASGLEAKVIPFHGIENYHKFGYGKAEIFTDYESYAAYDFPLDYTKSYFEANDLLVFVISTCSTYQTEFGEILENDGKLYPMFYQKRIGANQPVTDDFIVMPYYAELSKRSSYEIGKIVYRYK